MNTKYRYDVYGLGNALVDTEIKVSDHFLEKMGLLKGVMSLVDQPFQEHLINELNDHERVEAAGGSAANTLVGIALFGGNTFYTGKIGNDTRGLLYRDSLGKFGVEFAVEPEAGPTGTCLILVTPDGERTMQTSLGSSISLNSIDLNEKSLRKSAILYVEGYLLAGSSTKNAAIEAMEKAKSANVTVAISFSDPGLVEFTKEAMRELTKNYVDIVFCNEHEGKVYSGKDSRQEALKAIAYDAPMVFMTCGSDGSLMRDGSVFYKIPGHKVPVVDTTGAGDIYAAGVLYGITHGLTSEQGGILGSYASAKIVTRLGPRLDESLSGQITEILNGAHPLH